MEKNKKWGCLLTCTVCARNRFLWPLVDVSQTSDTFNFLARMATGLLTIVITTYGVTSHILNLGGANACLAVVCH